MFRLSTIIFSLLACALPVLAPASELPRPPEIENAVAFWTRIYGQVDSDAGLLHDRRDLSIVYEVVDLEPDTNRHQRQRRVDQRRQHYAAILRQLADGGRDDLSPQQREVLELFPENVSAQRLRLAANRIRFQLGQADRFRRGLIRSGAWEPHIRRTLTEMGLPAELAALPHVESSYNPDAYSRVGAAGIWQFTRPTGRRFMRVDHIVDERMDPYQSSVAAARLLAHNYSVTEDWAFAITAYNHGLAGIRRAVRATNADDIGDLYTDYDGRNWGFASRNFYPAFLAAVDVDFEGKHYFGLLERAEPVVSDTIEMPFYTSVASVVEAAGTDRSTLRELNRALRPAVWNGDKRIPRGYTLRLPAGAERPQPEEVLARIERSERFYAQIPDRYHTVQRGESLSQIAQRYSVSTRELVRLNNLPSANTIRIGQELRLPVDDNQRALSVDSYVVERGDSLSEIAQRAGVSTQRLAAANDLDPSRPIQPGQELQLPGAASPDDGDAIYTVNEGDNLSRIAERFGMSVGGLASANNIDPTQALQPGQELRVDGRPASSAETELAAADNTGGDASADAGQGADAAGADASADTAAIAAPAEPAASAPEIISPDSDAADEDRAITIVATAKARPTTFAATGAAPTSEEFGDEGVTGTDGAATASAEVTAPDTLDETIASLTPARATAAEPETGRGTPLVVAMNEALIEHARKFAESESRRDLAADPSDYSVADDGTIEIQAAETLGHYAEWLDIRASDLRRLNSIRYGTPVVIGNRLELDFERVDPETFESLRREYHKNLQARFFEQFRLSGTEEVEIQRGDSLWTIARRHDNLPVWLLRQYNPDLDFDRLRPGMTVTLPFVERHEGAVPAESRTDEGA